MADGYSLREAGKLLGLSRAVLTGMVEAGFVTPTRGPRREYRFSFKDLVVLRAAQGLSEARIPPARILRSLRRLRARLPETMPLSGLRIAAVGDDVVVVEGECNWRPDDGQYLLRFEATDARPADVRVAARAPKAVADARARSIELGAEAFARGAAIEHVSPDGAIDAYRAAIDHDPAQGPAYVNLGRLLHERGRLAAAADVYREALAHGIRDATLSFNLGVLEEDRAAPEAAIAAYRHALGIAPDFADAHFNLARLCEAQGMEREALRHWSAYRKLARR